MSSTIIDRLNGYTGNVATKAPCRVATTGPIGLYELRTIDGVVLEIGDRVLVKNQVDQRENGIYRAAPGDWVRSPDFDGALDAVGGTFLHVQSGSVNANSYWVVDGDGARLPGSDEIVIEPSSGNITLQANLATNSGDGLVGSNDGAGGTRWTTIRGFIAYLASGAGAGVIGFLQAGTGAVSRLILDKLRERATFADFGATLGGVTNDRAAFLSGIAAVQTTRGKITGSRGGILLLGTTAALSGSQITLAGEEGGAPQNNGNLPAFTIRGGGSGAVVAVSGMTGSIFKDFALDSVGTNDVGMSFSAGTAYTIDGIQAYNWGGATHRFDTLFDTRTSAFGYLKARNLNVLSTACETLFRIGKEDGDPTQFSPPMYLSDSHEISALDSTNLTAFRIVNNRVEAIHIARCTFNSYTGSELTIVDSTEFDELPDSGAGYAQGVINVDASEIDIGSNISGARSFKLANTALLRLNAITISGGGAVTAIADLFNSNAVISNCTVSSVNGPVVNITDLESFVKVGDGNWLNPNNTGGYFNPSFTMVGGSFTAAIASISGINAYYLDITAVSSGKIYAGLAISDGGVKIPAGTTIQKQISGIKGGVGRYLLSNAATATGTGIAVTQASGTHQTNSGIYKVPRIVDGANIYYHIDHSLRDRGVETFLIEPPDGSAFIIRLARPAEANILAQATPVRGRKIHIKIRNKTGGALGSITLFAANNIKVSGGAWPSPATGFTSSVHLEADVAISGSTVTPYWQQVGSNANDIPNYP